MTARYPAMIILVALCWLGRPVPASTAERDTAALVPVESVTVGEHSTDLFVRFDRPVSHVRSSLSVLHDGRVVHTLRPRLEAAPDVLFARIPTPEPGDYVLRWSVCPEGTDDRYDGDFPFAVSR